ncbi:hypothetical protein L873DRAFT_129186 [Choiromyces venosus 120613-1]|uniref:Uncharacterized protein n=1 Tax=Choiromyces venosus 120613-1 TaxID=1336337 RepID=A0A3N4J3U4_9PEZI|nr:hypothetical protein L873DRAFT_129186 [Choiromyces venosus 120613-1]
MTCVSPPFLSFALLVIFMFCTWCLLAWILDACLLRICESRSFTSLFCSSLSTSQARRRRGKEKTLVPFPRIFQNVIPLSCPYHREGPFSFLHTTRQKEVKERKKERKRRKRTGVVTIIEKSQSKRNWS